MTHTAQKNPFGGEFHRPQFLVGFQQPAVAVQGLGRGLLVVQVAGHHVGTSHAHLAVVGDLQLGARDGVAGVAGAVTARRADGGRAGALAHAVHLGDGHVEAMEELQGVQ